MTIAHLKLAAALAFVVAVFFTGRHYGVTITENAHNKAETKAEAVYQAAMKATAEQIAGITITNTTVRQKAEVIVRENIVYRSCVHTPSGLQSINAALTGQPVSDSELPKPNTAN